MVSSIAKVMTRKVLAVGIPLSPFSTDHPGPSLKEFIIASVAFRDHLLSLASWADKMENVKVASLRLSESLANQVTPPRLRVKVPEFQLTKEFEEIGPADVVNVREQFSASAAVFQAAINEVADKTKKAEVDFWVAKCDPQTNFEALRDIAAVQWSLLEKTFKIPQLEREANGNLKLGTWITSPQKEAENNALVSVGWHLSSQVVKIVARRHEVLNKKIEKREVANMADVEMADATRPGPSLQSLVDKQINARLRKLSLSPAKKKTSSTPSTSKASSSKPQKRQDRILDAAHAVAQSKEKARQKVKKMQAKSKKHATSSTDRKGKGKAK
ncbi:hypothetical protein HGRIS_013921 [Hohenbuehelia grisea]|uniref:Uncharacterized protein n=1 Tax=Hohenbuehelia grisea TaxID=104357 RepID=A0ABR3JRV3_9AGAR